MITVQSKGSFSKTEMFLKKKINLSSFKNLSKYGEEGVRALRDATPRDSGLTADSWTYSIEQDPTSVSIVWKNTNVNKGVPIAIILQYGHGTGTGGYVEGIDYINPALKPVFDRIEQAVWQEVTSS